MRHQPSVLPCCMPNNILVTCVPTGNLSWTHPCCWTTWQWCWWDPRSLSAVALLPAPAPALKLTTSGLCSRVVHPTQGKGPWDAATPYCGVYCTVLYCTVLYCTVLYCIRLCSQAGRKRALLDQLCQQHVISGCPTAPVVGCTLCMVNLLKGVGRCGGHRVVQHTMHTAVNSQDSHCSLLGCLGVWLLVAFDRKSVEAWIAGSAAPMLPVAFLYCTPQEQPQCVQGRPVDTLPQPAV